MAFRSLVPLFVLALLPSPGCDSGRPGDAAPSLHAADGAPLVSGTYRVAGTTAETEGGASRRIEGTIVLTQNGDGYTASFQLSTLFPGAEGQHQAVVIGMGQGAVKGRELTGTAHTQIVVAAVPGVDTAFAFAPRAVTTRIESRSRATIEPDGSLVIEIENAPAEGEHYRKTRTRLRGERIALASAVEAPPVGAEGEPSSAND